MEREKAITLLKEYNKEPFHIQHGLTVESVMRWYAQELGYDVDFWGIVGLLHDVDYEMFPEQHCKKAPELLEAAGCDEDTIRAICSHCYNHGVDIEPIHQMEKVLYATDELTGLIGAIALMRPSGSVMDMNLKSVKKKFKTRAFAAGCSRDIIIAGCEMLGWEVDKVLEMTLEAMKASEESISLQMKEVN